MVLYVARRHHVQRILKATRRPVDHVHVSSTHPATVAGGRARGFSPNSLEKGPQITRLRGWTKRRRGRRAGHIAVKICSAHALRCPNLFEKSPKLAKFSTGVFSVSGILGSVLHVSPPPKYKVFSSSLENVPTLIPINITAQISRLAKEMTHSRR